LLKKGHNINVILNKEKFMKYTVSILVEDEPGVLSRLTNLFVRRGFNIKSLAVGETQIFGMSRMTIVVEGTEPIVIQLMNQALKLVEVIAVDNLSLHPAVERELGLMKIYTDTPEIRGDIQTVCDIYRFNIVEIATYSVTVEVVGDPGKVRSFYRMMQQKHKILESVRTGLIGLPRTSKISSEFIRREEDMEKEKEKPAVYYRTDFPSGKDAEPGALIEYASQYEWSLI
jgi:acetolactate synthase-1/3 small subunit